jgi:hypothetical protein
VQEDEQAGSEEPEKNSLADQAQDMPLFDVNNQGELLLTSRRLQQTGG